MLIGPDTFLRKAICLLRGIAGFTGALIFFFLVLWGYNYQRIDLEVRLGIQPIPLSVEQTFEELEQVTTELLDARFLLSRDTLPLEAVPQTMHLPSIRQSTLEHLRALLIGFGIPAPEGLVARQLRPPGILLQISTAGFYFPLTGECNIDDGLHPLQVPFVLAHEYAHGYGIGDEGSCNFLAYLALKTADDPWLRYSGALGYWRYVASSARRLDPERYSTFYSHLNKGVRQDLISIRRQMEKFPDLFPVARDRVYSAYLQTQGITEGLANYSRVVRLARAWRHIAIDVPSCDVGKE